MSGVLHGVIASLKAAAAAATDAFFEYVTLLLNTTSTNGAQNNTFLDSSTNNFTVTRNGDTTQGSFNPYMPTGYWSGFFDGTGDFLTTAVSPSTLSGNFTIEAWVYITSYATGRPIVCVGDDFNATGMLIAVLTSGRVQLFGNNANILTGTTTSVSLNTWTHVAAVRSGSTITVYVDGVADATTATNSTSFTGAYNIGRELYNAAPGILMLGYISNLRTVTGTAVYTTAFTPPTTPLTAITNTSLLCLQDNRFIDNSTNAFAITRNGDTRISKFAPFNPPASYSTASYGGSGYFDGTGDYLEIADNIALRFGTGNFTIEFWVYFPSTSSYATFVEKGTGAEWGISVNPGGSGPGTYTLVFRWNNTGVTLSANINASSWCHVAIVREGTGTNQTKFYVNGTLADSRTISTDFSLTGNLFVGARSGGTEALNGYISNLRIVKGTAVYTAAFTPPTTPLTAITNTSLLLNFTNAGIYDAATINDAQTVGNAQVSTTQAKFGTTSMYFDGAASSRLVFPARPEIAFGTGNFTIEGWVYRADTNNRGVFQISGTTGGLVNSTLGNLALSSETGQVWQIYCNNSNYLSTATWSTNTWYHFALVRNSGTTKLYIDGTSVISQADTTNYTGQNLCVGGYYSTVFVMNGYIDELRITNGYARYTANFTPPTAAFPTS